jgi:nucleoside-diphosphate kinase
VALIVEGPAAIGVVRTMVGATDSLQAAPGTIRGDYGCSKQMNLVHASDGPEAARRQIQIFFVPNEIHRYELSLARWLGTTRQA